MASLVRSSETTALLANGISLLRSAASILILAVLAGAGLLLFSEMVVPKSSAEAERLRNVLLGRPPAAVSDTWRSFLRGESGRFYSAETWDPSSSSVTGVTVFQIDPSTFRLVRKSYGARGRIVPGSGIVLTDGWTRTFSPDGGSLFLRQAGTSFIEAPEAARTFLAGRADPRQMNSFELSRFIRLRRKAGADVSAVSTGLYQKSSVAVAPLLLTIIGLPFAFKHGKKGAVAGIGIALLLGLSYMVLGVRPRQGRRDGLPAAAPGGLGSQSILLARGGLGDSRDQIADRLGVRRNRKARRLREGAGQVGPLPGELREVPPEVAVGGRLPEDRPLQIQGRR